MGEQSAPEPIKEGDTATLARRTPLPAGGPARAPMARGGVKLAWVVAFVVAVFATLLAAAVTALARYFSG
jgi:hypothetical protein